MAESIPLVYNRSRWRGLIALGPYIGIGVVAGLSGVLHADALWLDFVVLALVAWLFLGNGARLVLTRRLRKGLRRLRQGRFEEALELFTASERFYAAHRGLDRLRHVVMLTPSATTLRESALCNIAFCHIRMGHAEQARAQYEQVLREYPNNGLARSTLATMELGRTLETP